MIVYHGTTGQRALKIRTQGFLPKPPSHRVWFAKGRGYSLRRARTQARRAHDRPVVLTCEIDLNRLRERLGERQVFYNGGIVAVNGAVPPSVIRVHPATDTPSSPEELVAWVNDLLGLKPYKGVSRRHPGIQELSLWVLQRLADPSTGRVQRGELLDRARHCLPELFAGVVIDPVDLHVSTKNEPAEVGVEEPVVDLDPREVEAMDCLAAGSPARRIRGLSLLAELADPDLFEWCVMCLEDEAVEVRVAALRTMLRAEEGDPEVLEPLAGSQDRRVRGAAIAALARHAEDEAPRWFERGLRDPEVCVRLETAALLPRLDASVHRAIFDLALADANDKIVQIAQKLTAGKGYGPVERQFTWRWAPRSQRPGRNDFR
jgi:hypothetical protein